jgi:hypothetical protein
MVPATIHRTDRHTNNSIETDHGRLKARLGTDVEPAGRIADAFAELALVI